MSLLKTLLFGRENGIRARLLGRSGDQGPSSYQPPAAAQDYGERSLSLGVEPPKDVTPPEGFEVVLHKDALIPGRTIEIIIAGKAIAVANVEGEFYAVSNTCPHAEGPLGEGRLEGCNLVCPYHGYEFDVRSGACLTVSDLEVETFEVKIVENAVCVAV